MKRIVFSPFLLCKKKKIVEKSSLFHFDIILKKTKERIDLWILRDPSVTKKKKEEEEIEGNAGGATNSLIYVVERNTYKHDI